MSRWWRRGFSAPAPPPLFLPPFVLALLLIGSDAAAGAEPGTPAAPDPHAALSLHRGASEADAVSAYTELALMGHPDRHEPYLASRVQRFVSLSER